MSNRRRPRGRPPKYPPEFQRDAVAMVIDEGRLVVEVADAGRRLHHSSVKVAVWLSGSSTVGSRTQARLSVSVPMFFAPRVRTQVRSTPSCGR
jgi:transposase-like protein